MRARGACGCRARAERGRRSGRWSGSACRCILAHTPFPLSPQPDACAPYAPTGLTNVRDLGKQDRRQDKEQTHRLNNPKTTPEQPPTKKKPPTPPASNVPATNGPTTNGGTATATAT